MQRDSGYRVRTTPARAVKFVGVGERQVRVVASTAAVDRMGDVLEPMGCQLANYRRNPVVLAQHDSDQPIARCASISADADAVRAVIEFPPAGTSERSDEYLRLMKSGVVSAVSVGFLPLTWEPLRDGGLRFKTWEMLELSCVSVGANADALVSEKSLSNARRARDLKRAQQIRARVAALRRDDSIQAQRARAAALKARLAPDPWATWLIQEREKAAVRLDRGQRAGAALQAAYYCSWW